MKIRGVGGPQDAYQINSSVAREAQIPKGKVTAEGESIRVNDQVTLNGPATETPISPEPIIGSPSKPPTPPLTEQPVETPVTPQPPIGPYPSPNVPIYIPQPYLMPYPVGYPVPQPYPVPVIQEPSASQVLKYALLGAGVSFLGGLAGAAIGSFLFPPLYSTFMMWPLLLWW